MDATDNTILQLLFMNARATNREIAELTGLSVSAVYKRIKALEDDHIITDYIARPSITALNSIPMVIIGRSREVSIEQACHTLGAHDCVFGIAVASGKVLYVSIMLRNITELQEVTSFVSRTANLVDPVVGIVSENYSQFPPQLSDYELRIIKSLNREARKPLSQVAEELGSSTKTVKKNLDTMIEQQKVNFTIEWAPLYRDSFVSIFHIKTPPGMDIKIEVRELYEAYRENIIIGVGFANIPDFILFEVWTHSPRDSQDLLEQLHKRGYVDIIPHILLSIHWYPNWMDEMVQSLGQ